VQLQERTGDAPAAVLSRQTVQTAGRQVPIPFELLYDPSWLEPGAAFELVVEVSYGGRTRFQTADGFPVLAPNQPTEGLEITLTSAP
jgi:putative lipoprotein